MIGIGGGSIQCVDCSWSDVDVGQQMPEQKGMKAARIGASQTEKFVETEDSRTGEVNLAAAENPYKLFIHANGRATCGEPECEIWLRSNPFRNATGDGTTRAFRR
jgi:hypothetical protein